MRPRVVWLGICILALLLTGTWTMAPAPAYACSCVEPGPVEERLERKTAVFQGTVTSIKEPALKKIMSSEDPVKVTFTVKQLWKGEPRAELSIRTAMSGASCGYEDFRVNEEYLIFAYGDPNDLKTGLCEGTKPVAEAGEELAKLGNGYLPAQTGESVQLEAAPGASAQREGPNTEAGQEQQETSSSSGKLVVALIIAAVIAALLAGVRLYYVRRKRIGD